MKGTGEPGTLIGYAGFEVAGSGDGAIGHRATPRPDQRRQWPFGHRVTSICRPEGQDVEIPVGDAEGREDGALSFPKKRGGPQLRKVC